MEQRLPTEPTWPLARFYLHHYQMMNFKAFLLRSGVFIQEHWDEARKAIEKTRGERGRWLRSAYTLDQHEQLTSEMMVSRIVDNFLVYLRDLLILIYCSRPEALKSGEQERLDFIFQHSTMEELVAAVAEKRVEEASFRGMRELARHFDRLGLELFTSPQEMEQAVRIVELRNLFVHNRGFVNSIFKRRVPDYPAKMGEHIHLPYDTADEFERFLANSAIDIDERTVKKFDLRRLGSSDTPSSEAARHPGAD